MATYSQANRVLVISSPLGPDELLLLGFTGTESISRLFSYQLDLMSPNQAIAAKDIVGQKVTWSVHQTDSAPRYFNGVVSRWAAGPSDRRRLRNYRAEVVPWPWLLTRTTDCRIFQNLKTPAIIETIFKDHGFSDYTLALSGSYPVWEYCVQYRETAFNFVSRLMELEGIFYYFRHEDGKHTLTLGDAKSNYFDSVESHVKYSSGSRAPNHVSAWEHQYEFRSGKWTRTDYNFKTPSTNLLTTTSTVIDLPDAPKYELFDYPGAYPDKGEGDPVTKVRMEEEEAPYNTVKGASTCCTFTPGGRFTLEEHEVSAENGPYVISTIQHRGTETSYDATATGAGYENVFTCIPNDVIYRPERLTPKPTVRGVQTAVVVGPAGEEIYVDKYGRVKVQFFWDRKGKKDENSSCWIRVSDHWAGKNWGFISHPRIGQEVIVDFLEGDPDRPLITGRVYNAEQMPPYDLPGNMTQSGIKSRSSKGGSPANYNELCFEDKKGSELVTLHAEKDQSIEVEHDEAHWVGHDRTKNIDHDETTHVKHDRTETVDNNETITIHGNRTETVDKNETITIHQNRTETVDQNETISIGQNRTETVSQNESITVTLTRTRLVGINESVTVGAAQEITVGAARAVTVGAAQTITVGAFQAITVGGNETESYGGDHTQTVGGKQAVTVAQTGTYKIGGERDTSVGADDKLKVEKEMAVVAGERIVLKTGDAMIDMNQNGTIVIKGKDITIQGSGKITVKADGDIVMKGSNILHN
jgi:type VI secretion system secreted protein VgrG